MKKITASLVMIVVTVMAAATATYAYFTSGSVLGAQTANTFATGSVSLGGFNVSNLNVTGLIPGVPVTVTNVGINYTGDMNADLYIGARGTLGPGNSGYIADKVYLKIYYQGTSSIAWEGYVNSLSTVWGKIADNATNGWHTYDLVFTLDAGVDNSYNGVTNTDTQILVYAVQHSGPVPATMPYQIVGNTGWW